MTFMLLLIGTTLSRGEAFLCKKKKAAIRATASVEAPAGLVFAHEFKLQSELKIDVKNNPGAFLFYSGQGGMSLEIKINGDQSVFLDPHRDCDNLLFSDLEKGSKIKLIDPAQLLDKNDGAENITISIIYTAN